MAKLMDDTKKEGSQYGPKKKNVGKVRCEFYID